MTLASPHWLLLLVPAAVAWYLARPGGAWLRWLRAVGYALIVLAMCEPRVVLPDRAGTVVVLADRSASMPADAAARQLEMIDLVQQAMSPDDRLAVVTFGERVAVEQQPAVGGVERFEQQVGPDASDLAGALRRGLSLVPADGSGRVLLLSDGRYTGPPARRRGGPRRRPQRPHRLPRPQPTGRGRPRRRPGRRPRIGPAGRGVHAHRLGLRHLASRRGCRAVAGQHPPRRGPARPARGPHPPDLPRPRRRAGRAGLPPPAHPRRGRPYPRERRGPLHRRGRGRQARARRHRRTGAGPGQPPPRRGPHRPGPLARRGRRLAHVVGQLCRGGP